MDSSQATGATATDASPMNSSASIAAPIDDPSQNLAQVISSIQKAIENLHLVYLTVSSCNVANQLLLLQRINNLLLEMENMSRLAKKCKIQVPVEVISLIDDGTNPDEFTRDMLNNCIAKNQITKGKTNSLESFRKHLLEELEQTFPEDVEAYRETRAASAAETKQSAEAQNMLQNGD